MAITVQGYEGVVEIPQTVTYSRDQGWKTSRVFQGPAASLKQLAASLVRSYPQTANISLEPMDANLAKLTVNVDHLKGSDPPEKKPNGDKEEENVAWTLTGQNMELSLWTHPQVKWLAENCIDEYAWLRKNLKIVKDQQTWNEVLAAYTATGSCADQVKDIFKLFRDGTENYQHSAYVISKQATIRTDAEGVIATGNVNKVFSKAQLSSIEGMPATMFFAVPDIEWLKGTPTITYQNQKLQTSAEWVGAEIWSDFLYYDAT